MPAKTTARFLALALAAALPPLALASHGEEHAMRSSPQALVKVEPDRAPERMDAAGKGFVTRDELVRFEEAVLERLEREGNLAAPEFTDRG